MLNLTVQVYCVVSIISEFSGLFHMCLILVLQISETQAQERSDGGCVMARGLPHYSREVCLRGSLYYSEACNAMFSTCVSNKPVLYHTVS